MNWFGSAESLSNCAPRCRANTKRTFCKARARSLSTTRLLRSCARASSSTEFQNLLKPAMTWKTRIGLIRDMPKGSSISYGRTFITPRQMRVATLTCGYADGYPRHLSNRDADVLVRGKRCPLLGRVTMDLMVIDVSHIEDVDVGDEVVLMGRQGNEDVCCAELGEKAGTITWEITTRIGQRVKRVFV